MPEALKYHHELDGPRPACFNPDQWVAYVRCEKELLRQGRYVADPSGFCAGCTQRYQDKMVGRGLCRHPDVVFVNDDDGSVSGVRPPSKRLGVAQPE